MTNYRPITDVWILARPRVKYYGAYPGGFLERARALLGVQTDDPVLHVCGGRIRDYPFPGLGPNDATVDLDPGLNPDWVMDVRKDLPLGPDDGWPGILADPPYTEVDAEEYVPGSGVFPKPKALLKLMLERVRPGGRVGMLHYVWPRPPAKKIGKSRKPAVDAWHQGVAYVAQVRLVACIGVIAGYDNKMRCYSVFEKGLPPGRETRLTRRGSDAVMVS